MLHGSSDELVHICMHLSTAMAEKSANMVAEPGYGLRTGAGDDAAGFMEDVARELKEVRKLVELLVRSERRGQLKDEVAARRLERMEKEMEEDEDMEHDASLEEAVEDTDKFVSIVVDRWFVSKGYGFGKVQTG